MNPNTTQPSQASVPPTAKPNKRRLLATIGLILVLAIAVGLVLNNKKPTTQPAEAAITRTADITITKSGVKPQSVLVLAGTQVTWTNKDKVSHQIAADPHPKDDSIPGLDKSIVLQKGDSRSYDFTKAGTYTYHDEKSPYNKAFQGTVVVR